MGAVVGHRRGPLRGPGLEEVDAHPFAAAEDRVGLDPQPAKLLDAGLGDVVRGSRVTNDALSPNCASETATFASPPPKVISSTLVWLNRRWPGARQPEHHLAERDGFHRVARFLRC